MFFSVDRETLRWIQKTLSRARCSGNWPAVFAREACWTPAVFAALVDELDRLLLAGEPTAAAGLGRELPRLAERIREELCPGGRLGKTSLAVWALAASGSAERAGGDAIAAERSFAAAFAKARAGVFGWTRGELERRFASHLLHQENGRALAMVSTAMASFAEFPDQLAECYNLRGVCRSILEADASASLQDFGMAIKLADPARSERAGWTRQAALHNLALQLVKGASCSFEALGQARKLIVASRGLLGKGLDARKLESLYVEGLLVYRIGWNRHGERLLERARQGLRKLGRIEEFAVATLDLAAMLTADGEAARAENELRELGRVLREEREASPATALLARPNLEPGALTEARRLLLAASATAAGRARFTR